MRNRKLVLCVLVAVCVLLFGVSVSFAATNDDIYFLAGQYFKSFYNKGIGVNSNETVVAKYDGEAITSAMVDYQKKLNIMRSDEVAADNDTDIEIINNIITNMILLDEAERLGLLATEAEIEVMIQNAVKAYSVPEGKEMMDAYCKGAGITIDEYLEILKKQAPSIIAKQKLKDAFGQQYCDEHGLEFTKVNPPEEMVAAREAYIEDLLRQNQDKIEYFIDIPATS